MSDLRPIGPAVYALGADLVTPEQLQIEHDRILGTFKEDRDSEGAMLRFAHLAGVAILSLRRMGESHAGKSDGRRDLRGERRPAPAGSGLRGGPVRGPGGGWFAAAEQAPTPGTVVSLRPH